MFLKTSTPKGIVAGDLEILTHDGTYIKCQELTFVSSMLNLLKINYDSLTMLQVIEGIQKWHK